MTKSSNNNKNELPLKIFEATRNQVFFALRYLEQALFYLKPVAEERITTGSDGSCYYYKESYLLRQFMQNPDGLACDYLHTVLHCLYRHPNKLSNNNMFWNLAADIAVTDVIKEIGLPQFDAVIPQECYEIAEQIRGNVQIMSAEQIERYLREHETELREKYGQNLCEMAELFTRDDHSFWRCNSRGDNNGREEYICSTGRDIKAAVRDMEPEGQYIEADRHEIEENWREIEEAVMQNAQSFNYGSGSMPGGMVQVLRRLTRESYDYTEFLQRFAQREECMKLDPDEFDYVYYAYGMNLSCNQVRYPSNIRNYPNNNPSYRRRVALIEPLEYREELLVRDFVIAIDTSGSCSGNLVQAFLNKTYNILKSTENFSERVIIHIIQCDCTIQEDIRIDNLDDLDKYISAMQIRGLGGTDFRPVFEYVNDLVARHEFKNLGGLIYFTDGLGTYPRQPPKYKTAFVFADREDEVAVPPWAMRLYLEPGEIME